jgi:hypothetical protein
MQRLAALVAADDFSQRHGDEHPIVFTTFMLSLCRRPGWAV